MGTTSAYSCEVTTESFVQVFFMHGYNYIACLSVFYVNRLFFSETKDLLVRFILLVFGALVAVFIVDKVIAFGMPLLSVQQNENLFDLIKTLTLMIFSIVMIPLNECFFIGADQTSVNKIVPGRTFAWYIIVVVFIFHITNYPIKTCSSV